MVVYLEDHPRTCKWLIPRVGTSPIWGCSFFAWPKWLINGGDPNHLLIGMILQVRAVDLWMCFSCFFFKNWTNLKDLVACGKLPTFKFAMVTKAFWNQTAFHFWIRNWQISPGCDWKWHWTFKAMMVKLDFQGWEVLPMFRDLLAYFCTNSLRYQRIFLQAVQKDNGDIWQYALVPRRKSKAETFWHLSQCQEINQWFTWNFLAMSKQAL